MPDLLKIFYSIVGSRDGTTPANLRLSIRRLFCSVRFVCCPRICRFESKIVVCCCHCLFSHLGFESVVCLSKLPHFSWKPSLTHVRVLLGRRSDCLSIGSYDLG